MAEQPHLQEAGRGSKKRRLGSKKGSKPKKKLKKGFQGTGERVKIDNRMKKLFRKRARDYNSDDDGDDVGNNESAFANRDGKNAMAYIKDEALNRKLTEDESLYGRDDGEENEFSEDEDDEIQSGITKFTEGCRAFKIAFKKIVKKNVSDDTLGPVLSGHKKLVAEKLAEEETERKVKGDAKKEKHLVGEKGHVKPAYNFLDTHEKFLIGVATKGVVKLFNAVNKAQSAQKGLSPSSFKDAKALRKRRKEAFFSELGKTSSSMDSNPSKVRASTAPPDGEGPAWAPLRDNYMLTNSRLKDWDKMPDTSAVNDFGRTAQDSSSDDD